MNLLCEASDGFITLRAGDVATAVHEYGHRLQAAIPALDSLFQELHRRRVGSDPVKRIRDIGKDYEHYQPGELTREDSYVNAYQGREYKVIEAAGRAAAMDGGALEVLTMAMEAVVGGTSARGHRPTSLSMKYLADMHANDRDMIDLVVGLLFHFNPTSKP